VAPFGKDTAGIFSSYFNYIFTCQAAIASYSPSVIIISFASLGTVLIPNNPLYN